nr:MULTISPECIES: hypothetical protein [Bacteroides]
MLCQAKSKMEVENIVKEDPFNAIADYQIIEFEVNKAVEKFQELLDK